MKLKIKNIGKIEQADIEIKGITVIAGLNNTGKSTVSRSLFAMFHSFSNLSGKIRFEKEITIGNVLTTAHRFVGAFNPNNLSEFATILVGNIDENKIEEDLERLSIEPTLMKDLVRDIKEVNATPDDLLISEIVSEIFGDEFNGHITNI